MGGSTLLLTLEVDSILPQSLKRLLSIKPSPEGEGPGSEQHGDTEEPKDLSASRPDLIHEGMTVLLHTGIKTFSFAKPATLHPNLAPLALKLYTQRLSESPSHHTLKS
ncbi:hypothetical protein BGE01nite_42240 [Brevifollis gellanilyticus]|uniref:Uncharacterized protein n=1 Tax=Brevifollis gellanilyticus TaxID=748831 RepID=A0A512MDW9_9BACT|nr:hypothetical protein BGE01nite_42240 [Brevifollis gellanilyticus]